MLEAAENLEFERAAELRDQIEQIEKALTGYSEKPLGIAVVRIIILE